MMDILKFLHEISSKTLDVDFPACATTEIDSADVSVMLAANLVHTENPRAPIPPSVRQDRSGELRIFTVPEKEVEPSKRTIPGNKFSRRRLITHTPQTNEECEPLLKSRGASLTDGASAILNTPITVLPTQFHCMQAARKRYAYNIDLKSAYHQIGLPPALQLWSFVVGGCRYRLRTIPTGASWCPAFAHLFAEAIAANAIVDSHGITADTYIDNIRFAGDDLVSLQECVRRFFRLCMDLGVDVNESLEDVLRSDPTKYTFLGVQYDHGSHSTTISSKARAKLADIRDTPKDVVLNMTLRQIMCMYGTLSTTSMITGNCRGRYYYVTKFLRRSMTRLSSPALDNATLDSHAGVWPSIAHLFRTWAIDELLTKPRVWTVPITCTRWLVYTDASEVGYGIVVFGSDGSVHISGGLWPGDTTHQNINVLEAQAWLHALYFVQSIQTPHLHYTVEGRIDNTSVLYRIPKGSSKSFQLNQVIVDIFTHPISKFVTSLTYVNTKLNQADWVSRLGFLVEAHSKNPIHYSLLKTSLSTHE
jgi:hypothetical protein